MPFHIRLVLVSFITTTTWKLLFGQKMISHVPQDVYLMDESMKSNIAFGVDSREIDQNLLEEVIKDAKLEKFINSLPDGLNTNAVVSYTHLTLPTKRIV